MAFEPPKLGGDGAAFAAVPRPPRRPPRALVRAVDVPVTPLQPLPPLLPASPRVAMALALLAAAARGSPSRAFEGPFEARRKNSGVSSGESLSNACGVSPDAVGVLVVSASCVSAPRGERGRGGLERFAANEGVERRGLVPESSAAAPAPCASPQLSPNVSRACTKESALWNDAALSSLPSSLSATPELARISLGEVSWLETSALETSSIAPRFPSAIEGLGTNRPANPTSGRVAATRASRVATHSPTMSGSFPYAFSGSAR